MSSSSAVSDTVDLSIYIIESLAEEPITLTCDRSQLDDCSIADAAFAVYANNSEQESDYFQCFVHHNDLKETDKIPNDIQSLTVIIPTVQPLRGFMERYRKYEGTHFKILARLVDDKVCSDKDDCVESFMKYREDTMQRPSAADFKRLLDMQMDMKNRMDQAQDKAEATEKELRKELDKVNSRLNLVIKESEASEKKLDDEIKQLKRQYNALKAASKSPKDVESEINRLLTETQELQQKVDTLEAKDRDNVRAIAGLREESSKLRQELREVTRNLERLKRGLVPVRKRIIVDNVRVKIMKLVLGVAELPRDLSWKKFIDKSRAVAGEATNPANDPTTLKKYLENHDIPTAPLTDTDFAMLYNQDERKKSNRAVHEAFGEDFRIVLESEEDENARGIYQRLIEFQTPVN
ncbi:hypothetical protein CPC08DRAFT_768292 [Agrocybe pediades]|nr:hypothetical protein CPC08DRAFT_768292 [Agrocybe pediades]